MITKNVLAFKKNMKIVEKAVDENKIVRIKTKKGNAIIMSEKDYNSLTETVYLASQPSLFKKIKDGEKEDINEMETYHVL